MIHENNIETEINLKELIKIFFGYKWLIIATMFLFLILSTIYLFFKPSIYTSHAIIEVNTFDQNSRITDDLLQNAFYSTNKEIEKEMEILKTFEINKLVIEQMDLATQIFKKEKYKKHELFQEEVPIKIKDIHILNTEVLGKTIQFLPSKEDFRLVISNDSFFVQEDEVIKVDQTYKYNERIKTPYFEFTIQKKFDIDEPIYIVLNGDSRSIYDSIVNKKLIIEQINKNAPLIRISYEDTIPERATTYVNKLVEIFLKEGLKTKGTRNTRILKFIDEQLSNVKDKLDDSEKNLQNYKVANNIINTSAQVDSIINDLSVVEVDISKNDLKRNLVNTIVEQFRKNNNIDAIGPFLIELGDGGTLNLLDALQKLRLKEQELSTKYTDEYPDLLSVHQQVQSLKDKIVSNVKNLKVSIQENGTNLRALKNKFEKALLRFPVKEMNLVNLTRTYEVNSKMYDYLLEKKAENEMVKVAIISDFKVVEHAYPANDPIKPKRSLIIIFSMVLGLIVGMLVSLIHHNTGNRVNSLKDIEDNTLIAVNAIIPHLKTGKKREIEVFKKVQSNVSNSFRKLRTDLCFSYDSSLKKVVSITSMVPREGKSFITVNLGAIFQVAGYRCIMIDTGLNNPVLHKYFDINYDQKGISNYLSGDAHINDIIVCTEYPNLDLIPIGSVPHTLSESVLSNRLEELLSKLKVNYDYIFIDTADIQSLTDTVNIMKQADINLIVSRVSQSKKLSIKKIEKMISKYNIENVGFVLNDANKNEQKESYI